MKKIEIEQSEETTPLGEDPASQKRSFYSPKKRKSSVEYDSIYFIFLPSKDLLQKLIIRSTTVKKVAEFNLKF